MLVLFCGGFAWVQHFETQGNALLRAGGGSSRLEMAGGNMEGKELRFGVGATALTAVVTSNTATGSSNAMNDSFSSLGGMMVLVNMLLGELVFGGLGTGLYSIVMVTVVAVFLAGLMVGRTPEYLGKKIGPAENKMIMLYALAAPLVILPLTAVALCSNAGLSAETTNAGAHRFTAILFAYTSCFANNGQAFMSLNGNTLFYNVTTAVAMVAGRYALAVPALGVAGLFAKQKKAPVSSGTLATDSVSFGVLLTACIVVLTGLSYLAALALGPVLERLVGGA